MEKIASTETCRRKVDNLCSLLFTDAFVGTKAIKINIHANKLGIKLIFGQFFFYRHGCFVLTPLSEIITNVFDIMHRMIRTLAVHSHSSNQIPTSFNHCFDCSSLLVICAICHYIDDKKS